MRLVPSRDGARVAVIASGEVRLIDLGRATTVAAPVRDLHDLALFESEVWTVAGAPPVVRVRGADLVERAALELPPGRGLVRAAFGPPAALWRSSPALMIVSDGAALSTRPVDVDSGEPVAVLSAQRLATARGGVVALLEGGAVRWRHDLGRDARTLAIGALFEGRSLGVLVERAGDGGAQHLLVLTVREGRLQHRMAVQGVTSAAFAARRGLAVLGAGAHRLLIVDMRFGRVLRQVDDVREILEVALDDAAEHLVLRMRAVARGAGGVDSAGTADRAAAAADDEVVDFTVRELVAGRQVAPAPEGEGPATAGHGAPAEAAAGHGAPAEAAAGHGAPAEAAAAGHAAAVVTPPAGTSSPVAPPPVTSSPAVPPPTGVVHAPAAGVDGGPAVTAAAERVAADAGPVRAPAPLHALWPLPAHARATRPEALHMLERYRQLVATMAGVAIARGWDSGSIAFVDESRPPFEREVAALVLGASGLSPERLRAAEAAVDDAREALRRAEAELRGRVPPLAALASEFGLSPLSQRLLLLVAAPSLWGELARLYGILANDEHRPLCDELLLAQLSQGTADRNSVARALDRDQPLIRHGLVRAAADRARPFAALSVDPLVLKLLRGDPLDADLDEGTRLVPPTRTLAQLRAPRAELQRVVAALAVEHAPPARLVVRGRIGAGRRTVAATLAQLAGRALGVVDAGRLLREKRLDLLPILLRRCALRGWLPMIEGLESIASDDLATRELVRDVVREHPGPLALRLPHDAVPSIDPGFALLDLPPLTVTERVAAWQEALAAHGLAVGNIDELAARFAIGPGVIERVVAKVAPSRTGAAEAPAEIADGALDAEVRQHLASRLGQVATRVTRLANWSQVILPADILDSVLELIARIRHRRTVYDTWGYDRVMATSRGVTALFQGGPGTGKTMVASAIANELELDLYRIDLSRVMSKWIGETEQNLAKVFDAAEEGQAIILFDEADSLFAKRTEVRTSVDRYANLEVNYLLQRLDSFEGIAILTTNFGTSIDAAFKRRLSFRLTFPFPDDETRELLWKAHLPEQLPRSGEFDLADLARRYRMSGGYIRNAALRAAFLAAEEGVVLTQDHLERAIRAEFREIGKLAETGVLE